MSRLFSKLKALLRDKDERILLINILLAFAVKGLSLLVSLFSMPLYIRYFADNDVLGIWYTVLSVLSWITLCDLGLGNGLRNYFTTAYTTHDTLRGKKYVSSTYLSLSLIILPILFLGCIALPFLDLNSFLKIHPELLSPDTLLVSVTILLLGVGINFILKSVTAIIYAIQRSSLNNIISLIISVLPLLYILIAPNGTLSQNLIRLSVVHVLAINLPLLIATVILFTGKCKEYAPSFKTFDTATAKSMLGMGMKFFAAQLFFMFLMSTNELFITRMFSADYVVEYSAYYKIFMLIGSLFMLSLTPLWSRVTKDLAEKKYRKIYKINRFLYFLSAAAAVLELLLVPFLQWIFNFWLKEDSFRVNISTALIFAVFGGLYICNIVLTTVANGMGELKTQAIIYGIGAVLKIPGILFLQTVHNAWSVVVLYNCIVLIIFCTIQWFWLKKRLQTLLETESACN